jgi:hypothetical protein
MAQNWASPVIVRRQPDIFCVSLVIRMSRSQPLLSGGARKLVVNRRYMSGPNSRHPRLSTPSWRPRYRFRTPCGGFTHQPIPGFVVIQRLAEQVRTRIGNVCCHMLEDLYLCRQHRVSI